MLSNSSCWSRNRNRSMSQATCPASAEIVISVIEAIKPFACSSKSLVSAKGNPAFACLSTSRVWVEGALPFGWKWPRRGSICCARAAPLSRRRSPATAKAAAVAGADWMSSRRFIPKEEVGFIFFMPLRRGSFLDYRLSGTVTNAA